MSPNDPQFLYLILVLPALFGVVLLAEGISKMTKKENTGLISIIGGIVFLLLVVLGYVFFTSFLYQ